MVEIKGFQEVIEEKVSYEEELRKDDDRINKLKLKALADLFTTPRVALDFGGINPSLTLTIYKKKIQQIREAESADDLKLTLMHPKVRYNGCEVVPDNKWVLPEEELILWSNTSLIAPLTKEGFERYMKIFKEVFPNEAASIGIA